MASPDPDKDDDDFIHNLLGSSTESQMEVDSNLLADEIRNLDCRLTNSGDKKSSPSKQKKPSNCVLCLKLFSNSWNLKQHLHLERCKKTKTTKCSSDNPSTFKTVDESSEASKLLLQKIVFLFLEREATFAFSASTLKLSNPAA